MVHRSTAEEGLEGSTLGRSWSRKGSKALAWQRGKSSERFVEAEVHLLTLLNGVLKVCDAPLAAEGMWQHRRITQVKITGHDPIHGHGMTA